MNSPYQLTIDTVKAIDEILNIAKQDYTNKERLKTIFLTLVLAERVLDLERVILPAGSGISFPKDKKHTEENLDRIRNSIWEIRKELKKDDVKEVLESTGNALKTRFLN